MEKIKLDLYDLWNEINGIKMDAEKVDLVSLNVSISDKNSDVFFNIMIDYNQKIIESLEKVEAALREEIVTNG